MLLLRGLLVLSFGLIARAEPSTINWTGPSIFEHPYVVSLQYRGQHVCDGSIWNEKWILTAASCLINRDVDLFKVAAGTSDLSTSAMYSVEKLVTHEDYTASLDSSNLAVDNIGLVRVNGSIAFNDRVGPIPRNNIVRDQKRGNLIGWGASQAADGSVVNQFHSTELLFPPSQYCSKFNRRYINPRISCAVQLSDYSENNPCAYVGGGPLVVDGYLVGIALRMEKCNYIEIPYTRVRPYMQWIESTMKVWDTQDRITEYSTTPRPTTKYASNSTTYPPYSTPRPTTKYPSNSTTYPPYSTPRPTTKYPSNSTTYPPYSTPRPTTKYPSNSTTYPPYSTPRPTTKYPSNSTTYPPYSTPWPTTKYPSNSTTYPPYSTPRPTTKYPSNSTTYPPYSTPRPTTKYPSNSTTYPPYSTPRPTTKYPSNSTTYPPYSTPRPTTKYPSNSTTYPPYSTPRPTTKYPSNSTTYPPYLTSRPTSEDPPPCISTHSPTTTHPPHITTTTERPGKTLKFQFYFSMFGNGTVKFAK